MYTKHPMKSYILAENTLSVLLTMVYATNGAPSECQQHVQKMGEEINSHTLFNRL